MSESGGALLGCFMFLAAGYMIASIVLQALILTNGMDGNYVQVTTSAPQEQAVQARFAWTRTGIVRNSIFPPGNNRHRRDQNIVNPAGEGPTNPAASESSVNNPTAAAVDGITNPAAGCSVIVEFQGEGNYLREGCAEINEATTVQTNQARYDFGCFPVGVTPWHPENNILLTYPNPDECAVSVSPTWTVAGWEHMFVQLAPEATWNPPTLAQDEMMAVKLLRGTLLDINANGILRDDGHWETYVVTPPNRAASLWLSASVTEILAGEEGAAFIFFKVPRAYINMPITDMTASPVIDNSGPYTEFLQWTRFGDYYETFAPVEFYNYCGMVLTNHDGSRLGAFQWWTFREDEDADGYHDHSNMGPDNTFAELHMNMYASSGTSGMQTTLPNTENLRTIPNPRFGLLQEDLHKYNWNDQRELQISIPLPPGYVHGPLWSVNAENGEPSTGCGGGVLYPYHRWLGGAGEGNSGYHNPPRYSMWIAFEHPPQYTTVPMSMLSTWVNAYLESSNIDLDCD